MRGTQIRIAILLAAAVAATGWAHGAVPVRSRAEQGDAFIPKPDVARATALGFHAVLADYYWLRAVQIVGRERIPEKHAPTLGALVDVVTTLNPWVDHPYRFAAMWLTDSLASVRKGNQLLERGIAHHPDEWRNRFYLGFNHYFYLDDEAAAAEALEGAARLPKAPAYLPRLVARLRATTGDLDVAEAFLREMIRTTDDERAIEGYREALEEVAAERLARELDAARARYRRRHGRDIARVEDLVSGSRPVLSALPPEPHGAGWALDDETGEIVSRHYGRRYEPDESGAWDTRERLRKREAQEASAGDEG